MGPALVGTMVQGSVQEQASKKLHPFFSLGGANGPSQTNDPVRQPSQDEETPHSADESLSGSSSLRRRRYASLHRDGPGISISRRKRTARAVPPGQSIVATWTDAPTSSPDSPAQRLEACLAASPDAESADPTRLPGESPTDPGRRAVNAPADPSSLRPKPAKVLKFNPSTGTLGSPPRPRRRPQPSLLVTMKYGRDGASRKTMAEKIEGILQETSQGPEMPTPQLLANIPERPPAPASQGQHTKDTHPFFAGKPKHATGSHDQTTVAPNKSPPKGQSVFMSTPVSPKRCAQLSNSNKSNNSLQLGTKPYRTKVPGAKHPLWPARGMSHVRGDCVLPGRTLDPDVMHGTRRKSKSQVVTIAPGESVIDHLTRGLDVARRQAVLPRNEDTSEPVLGELRLPKRHFESGRKVQRRVIDQLRTFTPADRSEDPDSSVDELSEQPAEQSHPIIRRLQQSLLTSLSAYDKSDCENIAWAQKYAPNTATEVLQAGREGPLLKEWLQTLKVQAVDTGMTTSESVKGKSKPDGTGRKKRRKKLDGFIVDSDDEADELGEVAEDEDGCPIPGHEGLKRTVIRTGDAASKGTKDQAKFRNAILLSGPHGCGKTAAVYAVANELDFEVFEINPNSRRSGKDLLEKVGDMTRNHLVQQHRAEPASVDGDAESGELVKDATTGKRGTMTSFFKPQAAAQRKTPREKREEAPKAAGGTAQKQSLILLEEVDVLYEGDKQFWSHLLAMMAQSKRPFVMTCNDETLVPIQSLELHAILRFSPPPTDWAVDLCLLIAANEGHVLQRTAVDALYASRNYDLRATVTELNYWCQTGVGDRRGGFDWFYLRWPKGSDLDENGDVVRVISVDTYVKGMGWVARDLMLAAPDALGAEQEALRHAWEFWTLDMGDWHRSIDMKAFADALSGTADKLAALETYENFCSAMSDSDVCSSSVYADRIRDGLDATRPKISHKTRDDFTIGRTLLDADPAVHYASQSLLISTLIKCLARAALHKFALHGSTQAASPSVEAVTEVHSVSILNSSFRHTAKQMTRKDVSLAFDTLAVSENSSGVLLDMSLFDGPLRAIVEDVAPWIRGIVAFDNQLMRERLRLSNLLSEGGDGSKRKRMRSTRSAYSALEGGERKTTRRQRYFGSDLNPTLVSRTCGASWKDAVAAVMGGWSEAGQAETDSEVSLQA